MKKIIGKLAWVIAVIGACMAAVTTFIFDNYILFYIGIGMLVLGAIGALFAGKETKEAILRLFDSL